MWQRVPTLNGHQVDTCCEGDPLTFAFANGILSSGYPVRGDPGPRIAHEHK